MGEHKKNTNYSSMFSEKKKIMILVFLLIVTIAGIITCGYYIYSKIKLDKKYDTQAYAQWVVVVSDNINDSVKWHFEDLSTERIDNSTIKATGNIIGEKESIQQIPLEFKKIDNGEVELIKNDDYKVFKEKIQNFISNNSLKADEEKIKKIKIDYRDINRAFLGDDSLVMPDSEVTEITPDGDNDSAYIVKSSMIIPKLGLGEPKFYPIKMKIQYKNGEYNFQYLDDEIEDSENTEDKPNEETTNSENQNENKGEQFALTLVMSEDSKYISSLENEYECKYKFEISDFYSSDSSEFSGLKESWNIPNDDYYVIVGLPQNDYFSTEGNGAGFEINYLVNKNCDTVIAMPHMAGLDAYKIKDSNKIEVYPYLLADSVSWRE